MKIGLVYISILILCIVNAFAADIHSVSLGLHLAMKAGISVVETPEGRQNGLSFNSIPDFGINGYYPISKSGNLGVTLNLQYSSYSFAIKDFGKNTSYIHEASYITFNPNLYFNGLTFGFGFGLPSSANVEGVNVDTKIVNTMIDFRFGYIYPLFQDETGVVNVYFSASYMLTKVYDNYKLNDPLKTIVPQIEGFPITDAHNPRVASVAIGFKYDFNMSVSESK